MLPGTLFGNAFRVTATGALCITSANAYIIGIAFQGSGTNIARLWQGVTATGTASVQHLGRLVANATALNATVNGATYIPFPAYCSGGICISNAGAADGSLDPSITLFWNPAGGA
jgi:hypothetical protein